MRRGDALNQVLADVFGDRVGLAEAYHGLLAGAGIERGLIGPREADRLWERHILNCAAMASLVPGGAAVVDVGSGAGLPGIPVALARPDVEMTLVEPLLRRVTFLTEAVDNLGISGRVRIVRGRADDIADTFDVVTARAVGPLPRVLAWVNSLMSRPSGQAVLLKGRSAAEELRAVDKSLDKSGLVGEVLTVRAHAQSDPTTVVRLRRR